MPEYSRPNLSIPSTLWGEVKVAAFRRGVKPVDVVIECLSEKYDDAYRESKGMPSRASVQRLRDKVESIGVAPPKPISDPPLVPLVGKVGKPVDTGEVIKKKCQKCFDSFPVTELVPDKVTGKLFCPDCVENMRNGQ